MSDFFRTRILDRERAAHHRAGRRGTNKDIARQIGRSTRHTKRTLQTIFDKTGCCTRLELALWELRNDPQSQEAILRRCSPIK